MKRVTVAALLSGLISLLTLGLPGCGSSSAHSQAPAITSASSTTFTEGAAGSFTVTATGSPTPSIAESGTLPGGVTFHGGTLRGTPTANGTFPVTFTASNGVSPSAVQNFTLTVNPPAALTITTTSLPAGVIGTAYNQTVTATGGLQPYTWTLNSGTLPTGLTLSSTGAITGTPTVLGTSNFTVTVTDSETPPAQTTSASLSISITTAPLAVSTTSLPAGVVNTVYTGATLQASGGTPPYSWSISAGTLPAGLNLNAGAITGTPTAVGTSSFTVKVTDAAAGTATAPLSITINTTLAITTTSLPAATVNMAYSATVSATGGLTPYTWGLSGNPSWLSINTSTGVLSGTAPATPGTTPTFSVTVTDSESPAEESVANFSITINAGQACSGTNDALLSGNYALILNGWSSATTAFSSAGSFAADGAGHISGGILDVSDQRSPSGPGSGTFTGTYCVGSNNLATVTLTYSGGLGGAGTFEAALDASDGNGHIVSYDSDNAKVSGLLRKQQTTPFSTSEIKDNYAFGLAGADQSANRFAVAGKFNSNGHGFISGEDDSDDAGTLQTEQTFSASDFSVASTGRGTATITSSSGNMNFVFYVVSSSELLMMAVDTEIPPMIQAGQVLQQSGTFTDQSLDGISVLEMEKLSGGATPEAEAGLLTADGNGSFSVSLDDNEGGTMSTFSASGNYNVSSNGRMTLSNVVVTGGGTSNNPVFYLVAANQAFVVGTGAGVDFGVMTPQTGSNFDNGSLSGNYLGGSQQPVSANVDEEVDYINADGGTLTGTSDKNGSGGPSSSSINQTYVVSSSGRVVVSNGGVEQEIFYIISPSQVVALPTTSSNPYLIDFHQ